MKLIYFGLVFLLGFTSVQAQTVPKEVLDETKTVTTQINNGKEIKESKVEINRRVEQDVKLVEADKDKLNQSRLTTDAKVTEKVKITNNSPFTSDKTTMTYKLDGESKQFKMSDEGFLISDPMDSKTMIVKQSDADNSQFVMTDNGRTEIGFFDEKGNFVVQKFDKKTNEIISKIYVLEE
ncbi:hypothetical protein [uncultured Formosa sp.]|uniref:hypothetical protein n=1 Tax=uncultured Formosa sp. TaxID=255435 RepID=UPI002603F784|nr:hypothetical protein [uncultured Formosa sp.]